MSFLVDILKLMYGVEYIFHFTDISNWESIQKKKGIYPRSELELGSFKPGGSLRSIIRDNELSIDKYVHCCFLNENPMEYRAVQEDRINSKWLKIKSTIMDEDGVLFTPGFANTIGIPFYTREQAESCLDFEVLYEYTDWTDPVVHRRLLQARKYEILIPAIIPLEMIEEC